MPFLTELPSEILLKVLSYTQGMPSDYMELSSTCQSMYRLCTSDDAWERFDAYGVSDIYRHFLSKRDTFSRHERLIYCTPVWKWSKWLDFHTVRQLNPYTQLTILLAPVMFGSLAGKITDRRVMTLGVLEPGNLIHYACSELQLDPELVRQSLRVRQLKEIVTPPSGWSDELKIQWHFAYANLDSEFHPPYPHDMYPCESTTPKFCDSWSTTVTMSRLPNLSSQMRLRIRYLTSSYGDVIKMGEKYYDVRDVRLDDLASENLITAALESGVSIRRFYQPAVDVRIRALSRGGIQEATLCEDLSVETMIKHNSWVLHRECCYPCNGPRYTKKHRRADLFTTHMQAIRRPMLEIPLEALAAAARRNAYLSGNYCSKWMGECFQNDWELMLAEDEARLNGRYLRRESRKYCQVEWYLSEPVVRPFVQRESRAMPRGSNFYTLRELDGKNRWSF